MINSYARHAVTVAVLGTSLAGLSPGAQAQVMVAGSVPLNDFCIGHPNLPCDEPVIGTRTATVIEPGTVTSTPDGFVYEGVSNIVFDGELQVDGFITPGSSFAAPYVLSGLDQAISVNAAVDYTVDYALLFPDPSSPDFDNRPLDIGTTFVVNSLTVSEIDLQYSDVGFTLDDGSSASFSVGSVDPSSIVDNATALAGSFSAIGERIVFGTVNGTATVVPTAGPVPVDTGPDTNSAAASPLALEVAMDMTVTTILDETGLITPAVAVTDGIEMNGSKVTGLAAGTEDSDAVNVAQLNAETDARIAADEQIVEQLGTETTARITADTQLAAAIDSESEARVAADTAFDQRLTTYEANAGAFQAGLANEISSRMAADMALANRIDSVSSRIDSLEARIDRIDGRVASSAAVATAMGGMAFLPDMKFNLTANVATYDGAHAGSFQAGILASPNVAINVGVATGFNRGGKTAARAGMTVGF